MEVTNQDSRKVEELLKAGSYMQAAELAETRGEFLRSAEIYAKTWNFEKAVHAALKVEATLKALAWAIDSKNATLMDTCDLSLETQHDDCIKAIDLYKARHLEHRAAKLLENKKNYSEASALYSKSKRWLPAAKCHLKQGDCIAAERSLEKQIEKTTDKELLGESHFLLGRLKQHLGKNENAVRHYQSACAFSDWKLKSLKELIKVYQRLGLTTAARDTLKSVRQIDDGLPSALDGYLALPTQESDVFLKIKSEKIAGRYTLERKIGMGGSGQVHLAFDDQTQKNVALKLLTDMQNQENPLFKRFIRESKIASSLKHKNIVEVHDVSAHLGYISMEFMTGGSLDKHIVNTPLTTQRVKSIALDVITALEVAHAQGVVHRDIKPANIFLEAGGTAKIGDFGVAHLLDLGQTQTGGLVGTLAYMSPEQMTGASIGPQADQYSLAITIFQCLTGQLPFKGPDFIAEHLGKEPPQLSSLNEKLWPWDELISKALSKSPEERFETLLQFAKSIEDVPEEQAHRPMAMPVPKAASPQSLSKKNTSSEFSEDVSFDHAARYTLLDKVKDFEYATITSGLDNGLGRRVHFEKWHQPLSHKEARRLKALSKGNPYLQKILSFEETTQTVIYEAPKGQTLDDIYSSLELRQLFKILKLITQILITFEGAPHFQISLDPKKIAVDERGIPTLVIAGTQFFSAASASNLDDVRHFSSQALKCENTWEGITKAAKLSYSLNDTVKSVRDAYRLFETLQHATTPTDEAFS